MVSPHQLREPTNPCKHWGRGPHIGDFRGAILREGAHGPMINNFIYNYKLKIYRPNKYYRKTVQY